MVAVFILVHRETREWKTTALASSILGKAGALGLALYGVDRPQLTFYSYSKRFESFKVMFFSILMGPSIASSCLIILQSRAATHCSAPSM